MPPWISKSDDPLDESFLQPFLADDGLFGSLESFAGTGANSSGRVNQGQRSTLTSQQSTPAISRSRSISRSLPARSRSPASFLLPEKQAKQRFEVRVPRSTLTTPRGKYEGWIPPAPRTRERIALASLLERLESEGGLGDDFIEFDLDQFSVYVESTLYPYELRPLQQLSTKGPDEFYFDGVLCYGDLRFYLERVAFSELPIGNYVSTHDGVDDQIWIRSRANSNREIYYKLKKPAAEYERFHIPFLWIADLAKHVVDYCGDLAGKNKTVTLRHFQAKFLEWLQTTHPNSSALRKWHQAHGSDDFRAAITANVDFIWKEVYGVLGHRAADSLQLFKEVKHLTQYRPFAAVLGDKRNPVQPMTVVTPYIYMCFGHSEFGALLEPLSATAESTGIGSGISQHGNRPDFKTAEEMEQDEDGAIRRKLAQLESSAASARREMLGSIRPGDTISTPPDGAGTGTKWKKELAKGTTDDHRWFGLVQRVHQSPRTGARSFDVTWLYRPVDTPCCKMVYPWSKELFLSDHCTCEEGRDARVDEDEVLGVHDVDWFGAPETSTADFFVRQTYQVEQRRWVTLERRQMTCAHDKPYRWEYKRGDTVLAAYSAKEGEDHADVYEVVKVFKQGCNRFVRLRRLLRRTKLQPGLANVRPNELVYTDQMVVLKPQRILGKCVVRFFDAKEPIPSPYDRNGTANVFFITYRLDRGGCVPIPDYDRPTTMRQGFDPKRRVEKLRGLDLFCGSGNFGRGLEEGGVVDMRWTNDIWTEAIHTYMANAPHQTTKPFLGSVDDLLRCAIEGDPSPGVPKRGEVDFISGGSPCQGFSLLTSDKTIDRQKKNRSLVASFASFVDFYRPKYGILENVLNIVQTGRNREEDAFSQLICAIVGMGYQTQLILGDAWTYGAPQSRSRAFLYFAAPGQRLPNPPQPSHSHFEGVKGRGLGKMANGESFVSRSFDPTPFKFVSAGEATADIPEIHDAKPDYCIGYPDHRLSMGVTTKSRYQYRRIPTQPFGMNFVKAWNDGKGVMTPAEREQFPDKGSRVQRISHAWGRVKPNSIFHTITTGVTPADARTGRFLHWHEDRPITILEARRAQGFPDHEVLVGNATSQYELVGNSVARQMALALGLQFREAWLGSLYDDRVPVSPVSAGEKLDAGLAELPMADTEPEDGSVQDQDVEVDQSGGDWNDDDDGLSLRNSPGAELHLPNHVRLTDTPPTSISGSEIKDLLPSASRKRPLAALAVEMHASKVRKVEAEDIPSNSNEDDLHLDANDATGTAAKEGAVELPSTAVVVERCEQIDLVAGNAPDGEPELAAEQVLAAGSRTNGEMAVRAKIDLAAAVEESRAVVAVVAETVVQPSTSMVVDLTED